MNKRDLRFDFLKGLAIIFILTNHLDESRAYINYNIINNITMKLNGFADSASVFIFISGYLFGMIYMRTYNAGGFRQVLIKAWSRAAELYVYTIFSVFVSLGIVWLIFIYDANTANEIEWYSMEKFIYNPLVEFNKTLLCIGEFGVLGILRLYIILIALAPFFLYLFSHKNLKLLGLALSGSIYLLSQYIDTNATLPTAWQFPFFMAMYFSMNESKVVNKILRQKVAVVISVAVIIISMIAKRIIFHHEEIIPEPVLFIILKLSRKSLFAPLIVINFLAWIVLVVNYFPRESALFRTKFSKAIIAVGQNTLEVFCFHSLVIYALLYYIKINDNSAMVYLFSNFFGWFTLIAFAYWVKYLKSKSMNKHIFSLNRLWNFR